MAGGTNFIVGLDPSGYGNNTGWSNEQRLKQGEMGMANMNATQNRWQQNQQFGATNKTNQSAIAAQLAAAQAAADANRFGASQQRAAGQDIINQKNQRFGQIFPLFQGALAGGSFGGGAPAASRGGSFGGSGPPGGGGGGGGSFQEGVVPGLGDLGPAVSEDQIAQNVNLNNAQNWSQAGGATRRGLNQLAGGGLGATSPLAKALQAQVLGGTMQANTAGATGARMEGAKLNADQDLGEYQARAGALASEYGSRQAAEANRYGSDVAARSSWYNSNNDYQIALAQIAAQKQNAILSALASFAS